MRQLRTSDAYVNCALILDVSQDCRGERCVSAGSAGCLVEAYASSHTFSETSILFSDAIQTFGLDASEAPHAPRIQEAKAN